MVGELVKEWSWWGEVMEGRLVLVLVLVLGLVHTGKQPS